MPAAKLRPVGPEDDDPAARHVLAAVVADALDDGGSAGVPDGEPLARDAAEERAPGRRAVEHGVADDHVLLGRERGVGGRPHRDRPAGEPLACVVVRLTGERQLDSRREPRAEGLAGRAVQLEADRARGQAGAAVPLRHVV